MRRIGVPLLSTLLTFNLVQVWLMRKGGTPGAWLPSGDEVQIMWSSGSVEGHLWFLVYLLVFCTILATCTQPIRRLAASRWPAWSATSAGFRFMLGLAVACTVIAVAIEHLAPTALNHEYLGLIDPSELLVYIPFFGMGVLLEMDETLLLRFSSPGPFTVLLGIVALAATWFEAGSHDLAGRSMHLLASSLLVWMAIRLLFGGFRKIASNASPFFRYLSDASYSIYLMHHLIVVALTSWLLSVQWGAWSKFAITLSLTISTCLAAHHFLILRYPLLRFLFNGKRMHIVRAIDAGSQPTGIGRP
jgi:glucan biosynthesis protein C